jgi:hypothetical protein
MWSLIKLILIRIAAIRFIYRLLAGILLAPIAFILKLIGWPVFLILGALAVPVMFVLFILGLPIFMVLILGGGILALMAMTLTIGAIALKVALFVVLPVWLVWKLARKLRGQHRPDAGATGEATA